MVHDRRIRQLGAATLGVAVLGTAAATLSANPAIAAGVITAVTTVSCSVTGANWCISGNNSSSGIGVIGVSKTGTGLRGTSTSQYGLKATSGSGTAILAQTTSGTYAINANGSSGGYGLLATGYLGAFGLGSTYGLYGSTSSGGGIGTAGVVGNGTGVFGSATSGTGVHATASTGYAVLAQTSGGAGVPAMLASINNGNAADLRASYIGVVSRTPAGGFPIVATNPDGTSNLFYVDGSGNVSYHGGLFHFAAIGRGAAVKSFSPNSTQPTVEDTGTAQLVAGAAAVRLDPTFAASIDAGSGYRVFVTPNGDTHGLFVATKTANGFIVRESQGGRSTVSFDYRIVATALGQTGQHMALVNEAAGNFAPRTAALATPALSAAPAVKAPAPEPASP